MTAPASPSSDVERLVAVSRRLGVDKSYVQGGGGNTSVKVDARCMWVKASGTELSDVAAHSGFVAVDYPRIRQGLAACASEADYTALVRASVIEDPSGRGGRPSIEAGFHAALGPAVLHSHSVVTNLLACAREGEVLCAAVLPGAVWVPYASPGLAITQAVAARGGLGGVADGAVTVLVLQNHGLVVAAATPDAAWQAHEAANEAVLRHFALDPVTLEDGASFAADATHLLFPDQAVYLGHETLRGSKAGRETQRAYDYLRRTLERLRLTPNFLPPEEASLLLNMEAEKYRQKVTAS